MLEIVRVRLADEQPISLERARFPADRFPGLLDRSLSGSLYELLMNEYGVRPARPRSGSRSSAQPRPRRVCWRSVPGAPLVAVDAHRLDRWKGRAFERSHDLFRADRVRIIVRVTGTASAAIGSAVEVIGADCEPDHTKGAPGGALRS